MLQSIQFNGSGPPTYVYSQKAVGTTNEFYHVFATETRGYRGRREGQGERPRSFKKQLENKITEQEEICVIENQKTQSLQEVYQREYGRRESFLWKQR